MEKIHQPNTLSEEQTHSLEKIADALVTLIRTRDGAYLHKMKKQQEALETKQERRETERADKQLMATGKRKERQPLTDEAESRSNKRLDLVKVDQKQEQILSIIASFGIQWIINHSNMKTKDVSLYFKAIKIYIEKEHDLPFYFEDMQETESWLVAEEIIESIRDAQPSNNNIEMLQMFRDNQLPRLYSKEFATVKIPNQLRLFISNQTEKFFTDIIQASGTIT